MPPCFSKHGFRVFKINTCVKEALLCDLPFPVQVFVLHMGHGLLSSCLRAWGIQARKQAGAHMLLRGLLVRNLAGAFREWHAVTQEAAHWRKVRKEFVHMKRYSHKLHLKKK